PNALAPIATVVAVNLAYLIVGVVVVEVVFVYPGIGQLMVDSVFARDIPVVQACALIFALTYIRLNLLADIVAIVSNPRLLHPRGGAEGGHRVRAVTADSPSVYVPPSRLSAAWRVLKKAPISAWFGLAVILFYVILGVFAPLLAPYGESEVVAGQYEPWSADYIFGTDQLGRDMLSRLIYGARNTVGIAFLTTSLSFLIGGFLGLLASIIGGWTDQLLGRIVDILMAIPQLIFALMLLSIFGSSVTNLILIIAILDSTRVFRLTRATA